MMSIRHFVGLRSSLAATFLYSSSLAPVAQLRHQPLIENKYAFDFGSARPFEDIPGPKPLPVVGNTHRFLPFIGEYDVDYITEIQWDMYRKYGEFVRISNIPGREDLVFIFNAKATEEMLRIQGQWPIRPMFEALAYYRHNTRKEYFGSTGGLLVEQKEAWYKFRSKVQQSVMKPSSPLLYLQSLQDVSSDFIKRIHNLRDENQEVPENFLNEMYKWALESIAVVALDSRLGCLESNLEKDSEPQRIIEVMNDSLNAFVMLERGNYLWKLLPTPTWNKFVKAQDFFTNTTLKYINIAMEKLKNRDPDSEEEPTLLQRILARDPDPRIATVMALDMILAGIDTTSHSVAFALFNLSRNPDVQEKLYKELEMVLPNPDDVLTPEKLNSLSYLRATIKESLRVLPVFNFNFRTLENDVVLGGYRIPAKTFIFSGNGLMSMLPQYFPEPKRFMPERWMRSSEEGKNLQKSIPPFISLPFGHGPRMCIGRRFAEVEMQILISKIIRRYRVEFPHEDIRVINRFLNAPDRPMKFRFYERPV